MSIRTRLFAATYDRFIAKTEAAGLAAHRAALLTGATGRTLEIGGGTGANLTHYGPAVESLTVTEPEPAMLKRLRRRAQEVAPAAMVLRAPAEDLPFDDAAFDTVVSTLTLCSVDDQPRAVGELRRVLRPGGRVAILEITRPRGVLAPFYRLWFDGLVPLLGKALPGGSAYTYLPASVRRFPGPEELVELLRAARFGDVRWKTFAGGIVALHIGVASA